MLLVRPRVRSIAEQKFPPSEFRALDARQKGVGHVSEVVPVDVIHQYRHETEAQNNNSHGP